MATTLTATQVQAASGDRSLYLYYTHTKETARITFRKGGKYDSKGLATLNTFLRDWRRDEPTKMDPALFDLIWEVYQESGASGPVHVVSAYRAPATNEMLRSRSRAVAKNSRHTMGMAMDFFIPGVAISKLRQIAMSKQVGGVGYYPTSGSPFVHLDTGNVRAWPRMTRAQLKKVFPDGKTLHVPNDGNPLSKTGYAFAKAQWTKCHAVPCSGRSNTTIRVANSDEQQTPSAGSGSTLLGWLFGNEPDDAGEESVAAPSSTAPILTAVASKPPVPNSYPVSLRNNVAPTEPLSNIPDLQVASAQVVPVPDARPAWLVPNEGTAQNQGAQNLDANAAVLAVASLDRTPVPAPRQLFSTPPAPLQQNQQDTLLAAYAAPSSPNPDAQRAVQMLIERRNNEPSTQIPNLNTQGLRLATASVGDELGSFQALFNDAKNAVTGGLNLNKTEQASAQANSAPPSIPGKITPEFAITAMTTKSVRFVAPDLDHVIDIFIDPAAMSSTRYAILFDHDEPDFDPQTELGKHGAKIGFSHNLDAVMKSDHFSASKTLFVATR
jgi:uncharacterized protein YcbK (DUF882 family)